MTSPFTGSPHVPASLVNEHIKQAVLPTWGRDPFLSLLMSRAQYDVGGPTYEWISTGSHLCSVPWRQILRPLDSLGTNPETVEYFRHIEQEVTRMADSFVEEIRCAFWEAVSDVYRPGYAGISHPTWKPGRQAFSEDALMQAVKDIPCPIILAPVGLMHESWKAAYQGGGLAIATFTPDCVLVFPLLGLTLAMMTSMPVVVDQDRDIRPTDKVPVALAMYYAFVFTNIRDVTKLTY